MNTTHPRYAHTHRQVPQQISGGEAGFLIRWADNEQVTAGCAWTLQVQHSSEHSYFSSKLLAHMKVMKKIRIQNKEFPIFHSNLVSTGLGRSDLVRQFKNA